MKLENHHIVYVKTNFTKYITAVNSSVFLVDTSGRTEIDRGYGDTYHHAQDNYFSRPIFTESSAYSEPDSVGHALGWYSEE